MHLCFDYAATALSAVEQTHADLESSREPVLPETSCLQYSQLGQLSVGPISYAEDEDGKLKPITICKEYYKKSSLEPLDEAYDIDAQLETSEILFDIFSSPPSLLITQTIALSPPKKL